MRNSGETQDLDSLAGQQAAIVDAAPLPKPTDRNNFLPGFYWLRSIARFFSDPYSELPPAPQGRWVRIAFALAMALALGFVIYFTAYTWSLFDTFRANAEDMGIMDQALWNTLHGATLHQTICNPISDTNCLGDTSRFAIHFEPIMLPLSLLYLVAPTPKALALLQLLVVASGAYPVFWIACRRLGSPAAGLVFVLAYLLHPMLQGAILFDFHAVTLTMAFLSFAIYFALTRNNIGLAIACVLALATKEEVPLDIILLGLAILVFQRRWKVGASLIALSLAWLAIALVTMHMFSPVGHSPTASRYSYLGAGPLQAAIYVITHPIQLLRDQILDNDGLNYLSLLLGAFSFLGLASPFTFILCLPALSINLLSSNSNMHRGLHQYSAEIVPIMVFSAVSGVALLLRLFALAQPRLSSALTRLGHLMKQVSSGSTSEGISRRLRTANASRVFLCILLALTFIGTMVQQRFINFAYWPHPTTYAWPTPTAHSDLANTVVAMIPAAASVSAQDTLVPHLSHRRYIYQYPYGVEQSEYVVLDTVGFIYPFTDQNAYDQSVRDVLSSGRFRTIFAQDGYLVLQRIT